MKSEKLPATQFDSAIVKIYRQLIRSGSTGDDLLPGTRGSLQLRKGTGKAYWYRVFYSVPGIQRETWIGREDDKAALHTVRKRMAAAQRTAERIALLRRFGYAIADKPTAAALTKMHHLGAFDHGLVLGGTACVLAWLNAFGINAGPVGQHLTRAPLPLCFVAPMSLLASPLATTLPFVTIAGDTPADDEIGLTLKGLSSVHLRLLTTGGSTASPVRRPGLNWSALGHVDHAYLLDDATSGHVLAGQQCIPVRLASPGRTVWHALHTALEQPDEALRPDLIKLALTLASGIVSNDTWALLTAWEAAPKSLTAPLRANHALLMAGTSEHRDLHELLRDCLAIS